MPVAVLALLLGAADPVPPVKLPPASSQVIDFDRDIQPLLVKHCLSCHGEKARGGLRLDSLKAALTGGNSGAVILVKDSAKSKLIHSIAGLEPDSVMPPGDAMKLTVAEVSLFRAWIDQGAKWGKLSSNSTGTSASKHWAFQPIQPHTGSIDGFIREKLKPNKLQPNPEADRFTLLRRLSLDLTGLPPSPEEMNAFLNDTSPQAYEKQVDRLLASPHYGERWARHWLDLARYADSDGYEKDTARPFAWRYRDWVIQAFNQDKPFDVFTIEQLAGDLLPNATLDQKTATGFHRNTLTNKEGGVDQEEFRIAAVVDRVNTTATVWLGLTVGCSQCHDHKYDPISQREYYQLAAFFNSDRELDLEYALPEEAAKLKKASQDAEPERAKLKAAIEEAKTKNLSTSELVKREQALAAFEKKQPTASKVQTLTLGKTRPTHVLMRGDFLRKGVEVQPGTLAVLPKSSQPRTRLDLAKWLVATDNPLTPRVTVNWVWGKFFGRGLVATPEDFGTQGQKPSHPELLDYLAAKFKGQHRWSLKQLHKEIVLSGTYRQSSTVSPEHLERDPLNTLLARQSRLRLESELVRDGALAVSGLLTRTIGGPSIKPPQPPGISELTYANSAKWVESTGPNRYKRGLYIWFQRTSPYPTLMTFDNPDSNVCVVRRERSNTPLQALTLLNDVVFVEAAQALAKRILIESKGQPEAKQLAHAVKLTLGREPTTEEQLRLAKLLQQFQKLTRSSTASASKLVGTMKVDGVPVDEAAAWVALARTLLNLDEFVTRD